MVVRHNSKQHMKRKTILFCLVPSCAPRLYQLTLPGWANPAVLLFALQAAEEAKPVPMGTQSQAAALLPKTLLGVTDMALPCWPDLHPYSKAQPQAVKHLPLPPEATTEREAELCWPHALPACWAHFGQDWGKRRYPRYKHCSWPYSKARLREWEQAVGEGKKHIFSKVGENMKSSWCQHRVLRAHTSNNLITTRVLLYPGSISALSLVQAVCQPLLCVQVAIVLVQEKVIVLRERVTFGVVGRGSVWALVSWRRRSRGRFQEFLDWRVIKNCCVAWPGPLQGRGQEDLVTASPQLR